MRIQFKLYNPAITDKAHGDLLVWDAEHSRQPFENLRGLSGRAFAHAFLLANKKPKTQQTHKPSQKKNQTRKH